MTSPKPLNDHYGTKSNGPLIIFISITNVPLEGLLDDSSCSIHPGRQFLLLNDVDQLDDVHFKDLLAFNILNIWIGLLESSNDLGPQLDISALA